MEGCSGSLARRKTKLQIYMTLLSLRYTFDAAVVNFKPGPKYTPVPLVKAGQRMIALSFELTKPDATTKPSSEKVTTIGSIKIVSSGGVGGSSYATGFKLGGKGPSYKRPGILANQNQSFVFVLIPYSSSLSCIEPVVHISLIQIQLDRGCCFSLTLD